MAKSVHAARNQGVASRIPSRLARKYELEALNQAGDGIVGVNLLSHGEPAAVQLSAISKSRG